MLALVTWRARPRMAIEHAGEASNERVGRWHDVDNDRDAMRRVAHAGHRGTTFPQVRRRCSLAASRLRGGGAARRPHAQRPCRAPRRRAWCGGPPTRHDPDRSRTSCSRSSLGVRAAVARGVAPPPRRPSEGAFHWGTDRCGPDDAGRAWRVSRAGKEGKGECGVVDAHHQATEASARDDRNSPMARAVAVADDKGRCGC